MFLRFLFGWILFAWVFSSATCFWHRSAVGRAFPPAGNLPWACDRSCGQPAAVSRRCALGRASPAQGDGISRLEAQGARCQPHSQPARASRGRPCPPLPAVEVRTCPGAARRSGRGSAAPALRLLLRAPRPGPRDAERRPGMGWDGTGRAGMGAGEGTAESAGGFKCGPGPAPPAQPRRSSGLPRALTRTETEAQV